jgi:hypothetical protein
MRTLATALLLIAAGCAPAPAAAPSAMPAPAPQPAAAPAGVLNPVGKYEFTTSLQGQALTGAMEITGTPGAYKGRITTSATEPIEITAVTVNGREMVVTGETPDGTLTVRMTFTDGQSFTGGWSLAGDGATMTGHRVP